MTVAFSDSHPTLYVVHGGAKPLLMGQTAQSVTCPIMEEPHTGWMTVRECYCHGLEKVVLRGTRVVNAEYQDGSVSIRGLEGGRKDGRAE